MTYVPTSHTVGANWKTGEELGMVVQNIDLCSGQDFSNKANPGRGNELCGPRFRVGENAQWQSQENLEITLYEKILAHATVFINEALVS